ncbi:MAG: Holliday junction resolvase RuvX [Patescibacteria group bacterium]
MEQPDDEKICLGIDWGEKRIGLALGDTETKMALPFKTVGSLKEVVDIIKEEEVELIVLGAPYKRENSRELSSEFEQFRQELEKASGIEAVLTDERLTTKEADSLPGDKKVKADLDSTSAMLILRQYLSEI